MDTTFELNNARRDDVIYSGDMKQSSPVVEIFSALVDGKDTSKYGKKTDITVAHVKKLGENIANGDYKSLSELNTLRTYAVQPLLMEEIKTLGVFGNYKPLGFNESIEVEVPEFVGKMSREQANNADVIFAGQKKTKYTVGTQTISGGWVTDYRKLMLGDMSSEYEGKNQVRIDMLNKAKAIIMEKAYNAVKSKYSANDVAYFFEGAGLTKAGVDGVISKVRRLGKDVSVLGDYSLLSQFTPYAGYNAEFVYNTSRYGYTQGISAQDLADIRSNGILGGYNGAALVEIDNPYDFTVKNSDGTNFETQLPAGLGLVVARGTNSPINTWTRGGLTTFSGNDVSTGNVLSRFDLEFACDITKGREFQIGMLHDTNLDNLAD